MSNHNISTTALGDVIVTRLIGRIGLEDVNEWFDGFGQVCEQFISGGRKFKLLVDRKGYVPDHFSKYKRTYMLHTITYPSISR